MRKVLKTVYLPALLLFCLPLAAQQGAQLQMDLHQMEQKAEEVVSVDLDGKSLEGGRKLLMLKGVADPVKNLLGKLKGVYLRRFWFKKKQGYSEEDVSAIREQVKGPNWVRLFEVKDSNKTQGVYSYVENEQVTGFTVLSEEEQEFTVVNIVGPIDLETLSGLGDSMGIPAMKIATTEIPAQPPLPNPPAAKPPAKKK
ncbi:MAG: DUF4252 domain-containing protein [Acidobacteria bacterium]|nr:DUF4252 domain-containing protein [Acidobacteriota bacterium]